MDVIGMLEQQSALDRFAAPLQRLARLVPAPARDVMHGVWLGHPVHPALVQLPIGTWTCATLLGGNSAHERVVRRLTWLGLATAVPAAATGACDWAELHEQQVRVGIVHAAANWAAIACFGMSLACRTPGTRQAARLVGLASLGVSGLLGGHLSFRMAAGANHAEAVPHLLQPGWQHLMTEAELPDNSTPVRRMLGEVPVVVVMYRGQVRVLADQCSHLSGPLSDGECADGLLRCPWHGSAFRLDDGSVARGPATAPQPCFETRTVGGAIQVMLPGAG